MGTETQKVIGKILTSPAKTAIVATLSKEGKVQFSDLQEALQTTNGNLNYHLLDLQNDGIVQKNSDGAWVLSGQGTKVSSTVRNVVKSSTE